MIAMVPSSSKHHIRVLVVEDMLTDYKLLHYMLEDFPQHEYEIKHATTLEKAAVFLAEETFDVILLDLNLPDSSGLETLEKLEEKAGDTAIIVITGEYSDEIGYKTIAIGAQEYLTKGNYDVRMLNKTIHYAVERKKVENELKEGQRKMFTLMSNLPGMAYRALNDEHRTMEFISEGCSELTGYEPDELEKNRRISYSDMIHPEDRKGVNEEIKKAVAEKRPFRQSYRIMSASGAEKWVWEQGRGVFSPSGRLLALEGFITDITDRKKSEERLEQSFAILIKTFEETVNVLSSAVETRDPYTAGHQKRVAQLSAAIARSLGFSEEMIKGIAMAAAIHDIGKIYVPIEILINPGKLNEIEFSIIKTHSQVGYDILKSMKSPWPLAKMVLQHHERINGAGYPNGLRGDEILRESKIIAVADVVEAMASHRPYRPALGIEKALEEIIKNRGVLYDPEVVDACLVLFRGKHFVFK